MPSKSKPIKVDSKSMIGLKAIIYNEEKKRSGEFLGGGVGNASNRNVRGSSLGNKRKGMFDRKNSGVDARSEKSSKLESERLQNSSLAKKAELYDLLCQSSDTDKSGFLVDFGTSAPAPVSTGALLEQQDRECTGRDWEGARIQKRLREGDGEVGCDASSSTADSAGGEPHQWQWGTGRAEAPTLDQDTRDSANARRLREMFPGAVECKKLSAPGQGEDGGARVRTQWERALQNNASGRLAAAKLGVETSVAPSVSAVTSGQSSKQARLALLLARKQSGKDHSVL